MCVNVSLFCFHSSIDRILVYFLVSWVHCASRIVFSYIFCLHASIAQVQYRKVVAIICFLIAYYHCCGVCYKVDCDRVTRLSLIPTKYNKNSSIWLFLWHIHFIWHFQPSTTLRLGSMTRVFCVSTLSNNNYWHTFRLLAYPATLKELTF